MMRLQWTQERLISVQQHGCEYGFVLLNAASYLAVQWGHTAPTEYPSLRSAIRHVLRSDEVVCWD